MKNIFLIFAALLATGCVGPMVVHETARTVGKNNSELIAGYGVAGVVAKYSYGLSDDLDLGVQWESLSLGLRLKYAFINNKEEGWSLAGAGGYGASIGGNHYYADLIGSYLTGPWEPYTTLRMVHVKLDPVEFKDKDTGGVNFTVDVGSYNYGQFMMGSRYWFNQNWLLSVELSTLFVMTSGVKISDSLLVGGAFGYRF